MIRLSKKHRASGLENQVAISKKVLKQDVASKIFTPFLSQTIYPRLDLGSEYNYQGNKKYAGSWSLEAYSLVDCRCI